MDLLRHGLRLVGLLCAESALVAGLHELGTLPPLAAPGGDVAGWLAVTPAEDAIAVVARLVALAGAWWLLLSTVVYAAARATGLPRLLAMVEWGTLPAVRRVADRAIAVTLATSAVLAPNVARAAEQPAPPVPVVVADDEPTGGPALPGWVPPPTGLAPDNDLVPTAPVVVADDEPTTAPAPVLPDWVPPPAGLAPGDDLLPTAPTPDPPPPASAPTAPTADEAHRAQHVVRVGEHLWSIAEDQVAGGDRDAGQAAAERDVAAYWRQLVAGNEAWLRSGDADLIFPGEVVVLPPPQSPDPGASR